LKFKAASDIISVQRLEKRGKWEVSNKGTISWGWAGAQTVGGLMKVTNEPAAGRDVWLR
jgi:hypothetical protein